MKNASIVSSWPKLQQTFASLFDARMAWPGITVSSLLAEKRAAENSRFWHLIPVIVLALLAVVPLHQAMHYLTAEVSSRPSGWTATGYGALTIIILYVGYKVIMSSFEKIDRLDWKRINEWKNAENLFGAIYNYRPLSEGTNSEDLIWYLEQELRKTVREINKLVEERKQHHPMHENPDEKAPRQYLKDLMDLVVRLELMGTGHISIGMCDDQQTLYDARADWFYGKLFENPNFVIDGTRK